MRPTITVLRAWNPAALTVAATQLDGMTQTFDTQLHTMLRQVDTTAEHWKGEGATAATARALGETTAANHVSTAILGIVDVLNTWAGDLASAREHALRVVDDALARGCTVAEDATGPHPQPHRDRQSALPLATTPPSPRTYSTVTPKPAQLT